MRTIGGIEVKIWQDGNTVGSTEEIEELTVCLEYQMAEPGKGENCFYVLKTEGWSIDGPEELKPLLEDIRSAAQKISEGGDE